jgi:hypothetical protein
MPLSDQVIWLFLLAISAACISLTVTHEEIFREPREYCERCSRERKSFLARKFFYVFTCEYCFSHYVTLALILITKYHLLLQNAWGYVIAWFAVVWIANIYMSVYNFIRVDIKKENIEIREREKE